MKKNIFDISQWDNFNELQKNQIESEGYLRVLEYLLNNNIDVNDDNYQYYEKKYLEKYTNLFFIKNSLSKYLQTLDPQITRWEVNFYEKTIEVYYAEEI